MTCTLNLGSETVTLASDDRGASTSGLVIGPDAGEVQVVPILRAKEPRQRDRGNRLTVVSFRSQVAFPSIAEAEDHVLGLPLILRDQGGATATLEGTATTLTLHEVIATVQASHLGCRVFYTVTLRGRLTE